MAKGKKAAVHDSAEVELTRTSDIESTPQGVVKRWLAELSVADETEKEWRAEAEKIWKVYEAENQKANSFNILWSNTEILMASVYNSTPQPDVRRRFRDADPVGMAVSTVLERSLSYVIDDYDFDSEISDSVLDMLLVGRGFPRIKYEPRFIQVGPDGAMPGVPAGAYQEPPAQAMPADAMVQPADGAQAAPPHERLADQQVACEHVQWNKFRRGPGKRWNDLPWIAFEHEFTMEMAQEKFGPQIAAKIKYSQGADTERASDDKRVKEIFKVAVVHEIWDKDRRRVLFIAPTCSDAPCLVVDDPLQLKGFWPCPKPAYAVQNSRTLVPTPLFRLYKEQAAELDRISARINKVVNALRLRGAYSSHLPELAGILEADDGTMLPIESPAEVAAMGGLDKAIWIMPIDKLQLVLQSLYQAREQTKQTIYEIIGIGDILRGASDPTETAKAQQIKSQWGSIRVQKMQREIQRMVRDLMRLKAEVIAQQFTPEQLAAITNVQLPTADQKQQAQMSLQMASRQPPQMDPMTGQPMPPPPPDPQAVQIAESPSWDEVMEVMRSDEMRSYRIDVETDSTVAETLQRDMTGLAEVISGVGNILGAIQTGLPVEVAKEVALAIVRRARLGSAVEDALENFEAPPPQAPDAGEQLMAAKEQILELIRSEGEKQVREKDAAAEHEAGLQQYDQQIQQTLGTVGQVAQQGSQAIEQTAQTAQASQQLLQQVVQITSSLAQAVTALQQQTAQIGQTMQAIIQAIQSPPPGRAR
jgi:hypothetical protein